MANADNPAAQAAEVEDLAASNGHAQAPAAEAPPCADCEDGLTIGLGRGTERALGLFGIVMGGLIVLMGIDLLTGGRLARLGNQIGGLGRSDADPSA